MDNVAFLVKGKNDLDRAFNKLGLSTHSDKYEHTLRLFSTKDSFYFVHYDGYGWIRDDDGGRKFMSDNNISIRPLTLNMRNK